MLSGDSVKPPQGKVTPQAIVRVVVTIFANLPTVPLEGMLFTIVDSTTATIGATIAGGGVNHVLGYFNGTVWTVAAK